jgi:membrane-associated protease RseP (regulator of RpoE activity)
VFPEDLIESAQADVGPGRGFLTTAAPPAREIDPVRFENAFEDPFENPGSRFELDEGESPQRVWLHVLLFIATLFTTTLVGAHMMFNFRHDLPVFDIERLTEVFSIGLRSPASFASGLPFSLTLLTILMAHEMGHYVACLWYGVDATLPFFLPSPVPGTGTFGAFIRIRSHIPTKRALFDIGVAGPLAGFVFLTPALLIGLAYSRILPGIGNQGAWQLGVPTLQWLAQRLIFPGVRSVDIYLHPMARAAWVGMLATAINLLPAGQLDGGHIVYALFGRAHKWVTWAFIAALLPMGWFYWYGWLVWAVLLFFFARRHPPVYDHAEIGAGRVRIGVLALVVFLLCFTLSPVNN